MPTDGDSQLPNLTSANEDSEFHGVLATFRKGNSGQAQTTTDETARKCADLVEAALKSPERLDQLLLAMFPDGPRGDAGLYEQLERLGDCLEFGDAADRVRGLVWSAALQRLDDPSREKVLLEFAAKQSHDLFGLFGALKTVVREHEFRPVFIADFFSAVTEKILSDLAQGGFWQAVKTLCDNHASMALQTLPHLVKLPNEARVQVASFIAGTLRKLPLMQRDRETFDVFETQCKNDSTGPLRSVIIRSWVNTAWQSGITVDELNMLLSHYGERDDGVRNQLIGTVCRIVPIPTLAREVSEVGFRWLRSTVSGSLDSLAKFSVAALVATIATRAQSTDQPSFEGISELLFAIQPIPTEDGGTWQEVQRYLVALLDNAPTDFESILVKIAQRDPVGLHAAMHKPRRFDWLLGKMSGQDVAIPIGELIVSSNGKCRQLGFYLFDRLNIDAIPESVLDAAGDRGVRLAFYELQRNLLSGEATARVLVSLLPRVDDQDPELFAAFARELYFQSLNLAIGFRGELEKRAADSPLVKQVFERLASYHQGLKQANDAGVSSMDIPGFSRAIRLHQRRFSKQVSDSAKEHSIMMQLAKQISLLYGCASGTYVDGQLRGPFPLGEFSHSMELPMLAFSDPEGMILRRWQLAKTIATLQGETQADEAEDEV